VAAADEDGIDVAGRFHASFNPGAIAIGCHAYRAGRTMVCAVANNLIPVINTDHLDLSRICPVSVSFRGAT
jgi:hypothetical protein